MTTTNRYRHRYLLGQQQKEKEMINAQCNLYTGQVRNMWAYPNNNISNHHHQQENDFVLIPSPTQYESSSSHTHTHTQKST